MDPRSTGLVVAFLGIAIVVAGLLIATGLLSWFGHLPGDIRIHRDGLSVYAPFASMLLLSIVLSLALWLVGKLL